MIVNSSAQDIVYSSLFTGIHGNYLKDSVRKAGLDPDNPPSADKSAMNFGQGRGQAWKDIWGSGQGVARWTTCHQRRRWSNACRRSIATQ